jgi:PilZ domain-containing protein
VLSLGLPSHTSKFLVETEEIDYSYLNYDHSNESMTDTSRRASLRLPIKMKVRITTETFCTRHLITEDFSDGGIFVIDEQLSLLDVGSVVNVQADEGLEDAPIVRARVAWTNNKGAGLQYMIDEM